MSLIFDLVFVLIILVSVIVGAKRGFFRSFMSLISTLAAFVIAWIFTPKLSAYLSEKFLSAKITGFVSSKLKGLLTSGDGGYDIEKLFDNSPDAFKKLLSGFGADRAALEAQYGSLSAAGDAQIEKLASDIAKPVTNVASNVLAFLGLFIAALIVLCILSFVIGLIMKLPVLRTLDSTLGLVFGLIVGGIIAFAFARVAPHLVNTLSALNPDTFPSNIIDNTIIIKNVISFNISSIWDRIFPTLNL